MPRKQHKNSVARNVAKVAGGVAVVSGIIAGAAALADEELREDILEGAERVGGALRKRGEKVANGVEKQYHRTTRNHAS